ncbi:MAG TPA: flagellar basal body rod protein FlgB [Nitrospiraceae bacterium]|nr:flagellar basal body rod protein FlgB [Nitrospiraceae bacterium]
MTIFDKTMRLIERTLDLRAARHQVIVSNIANEETPGYRSKDMRFQDALTSAAQGRPGVSLVATHRRHLGVRGDAIAGAAGRVVETGEGDLPLDANTVNLEIEMAKLSDNAMQYNTAATIMGARLRQLLGAIREGR